ncbi:hypothetical protein [Ferviditalea candida]|uniref:Uncharacterized protein n=1 Tax=Ferviditalea candida TaxID=3108399 RepID=A0ABU5ZKB4_9BACL|nr:hypothetical protein [Paenibacillaceae bacterium T2]
MTLFQLPAAIRTGLITSPGISIYYPLVFGLPDPNIERHINQTIYALMLDLLNEQKKVQTGSFMEMTGHYEIKTNERGILSLILFPPHGSWIYNCKIAYLKFKHRQSLFACGIVQTWIRLH